MPGPDRHATPALGERQARRLRTGLLVALGLGVLTAGAAVWGLATVVPDDRKALPYFVMVTAIAAVVLGASTFALRLLPARSSAARSACLVSGGILVLLALPLVGFGLGVLMPVVGLTLVFVCLSADDPAATGPRRR